MTTVASNARTAFTPSSSKRHPALAPPGRGRSRRPAAAQRSSPAWDARPSLSPVNASESLHVSPTFARHRPLGRRSSTNSAKRRRSLRGLGADMTFLGKRVSEWRRADRGARPMPPPAPGRLSPVVRRGRPRGRRWRAARPARRARPWRKRRADTVAQIDCRSGLAHRNENTRFHSAELRAALGGDRHVPAAVALLDHSPGHRRLHEVDRKVGQYEMRPGIRSRAASALASLDGLDVPQRRQLVPGDADVGEARARLASTRLVPHGIAVNTSGSGGVPPIEIIPRRPPSARSPRRRASTPPRPRAAASASSAGTVATSASQGRSGVRRAGRGGEPRAAIARGLRPTRRSRRPASSASRDRRRRARTRR